MPRQTIEDVVAFAGGFVIVADHPFVVFDVGIEAGDPVFLDFGPIVVLFDFLVELGFLLLKLGGELVGLGGFLAEGGFGGGFGVLEFGFELAQFLLAGFEVGFGLGDLGFELCEFGFDLDDFGLEDFGLIVELF